MGYEFGALGSLTLDGEVLKLVVLLEHLGLLLLLRLLGGIGLGLGLGRIGHGVSVAVCNVESGGREGGRNGIYLEKVTVLAD